MGMGPRTNLYRIGGDTLTQLNLFNYKKLNLFFLHKKRWPVATGQGIEQADQMAAQQGIACLSCLRAQLTISHYIMPSKAHHYTT